MNIQEATKLAMEKGISIRRENQDVYGILPTNLQRYQCLVVSRHYKKKKDKPPPEGGSLAQTI